MDAMKQDDGFSLVEVLVGTVILTTAVLSMVGVMAIGVQRAAVSSEVIVAREKAREAVESVHTARDIGALTWASVRNTTQGGVFLAGAQPLKVAGEDGLVNTADDGNVEQMRTPGPDGILGNANDSIRQLDNFTREIAITDLPGNVGGVNPNLRQVTVTIRYQVRGMWRTYTLRTYVSAFV